MRILHAVHQFMPEYVGGTEVYVADLATRLRDRGHAVAVFSGGAGRGRRSWEGIEVETVPGGVRGPQGPVRTFWTTFGNRPTEAAFSDLLARFRPDVVHFHHLLGLSGRLIAIAQRRGLPACYTLHDYWFMCPKTQLIDHAGRPCPGPRAGVNCSLCAAERLGVGWDVPMMAAAPLFILRERWVKRAIGDADLLLAPSEFIARMASKNGLPEEKLRLVNFGLDTEQAVPHRPRAKGTPLRVTCLGAIEESKGVHVLAEAARLLDGIAQVRAYGDPGAYPEYAGRLPKTMLMGQASRDAVPGILADSDAVAVPSLWYENAPMVIAEAHAAGVPVVASDIGALPEQVGSGGLLVPPGDAPALAAALRRLAEEPGLLDGLRDNVNRQVRPPRSAHVDEMEAIYQELVQRATTRLRGPQATPPPPGGYIP